MTRLAKQADDRRLEAGSKVASFVEVLGVTFAIALAVFAILEIVLAPFQEREASAAQADGASREAASDHGETGP